MALSLVVPNWLETRLNELEDIGSYVRTESEEKEFENLSNLVYTFTTPNPDRELRGTIIEVVSIMEGFIYGIRREEDLLELKLEIYKHTGHYRNTDDYLKVIYAASKDIEKDFEGVINAARRQYNLKEI